MAHCTDVACTMSTLTQYVTPISDGYQPSITTGADALGLIVYMGMYSQAQVVTVHCVNTLCNAVAGPQLIHSLQVFNPQPMVTIGAAGLGVITFYDMFGSTVPVLVVAHCHDLLCSSTTETNWMSGMSPPAITISPTGNPLLTSPGQGSGLLQVFLCRDPFCAEFFRRR